MFALHLHTTIKKINKCHTCMFLKFSMDFYFNLKKNQSVLITWKD